LLVQHHGSPLRGHKIGLQGTAVYHVIKEPRSPDMPDEELAWRVIEARRNGDVDTLIEALQDETQASIATDILGDLGVVSAISAIVPLLDATNPQQRAAAVRALAKLEASIACPRIMEIATTDEVPWVRAWATQAVGRLPCESEQLLVRALEDSDIRVRRVAVEELTVTGTQNVIPALESARKREHWFARRLYLKAVRRIRRRARQS
jgi:HEAT repeat protein